MFDNFLQEGSYRAWDRVWTDAGSGNGIYIGDVGAATDLAFIAAEKIRTVVTAARDMEHVQFADDSVLHITYPLLDGKQEQIAPFFDKFHSLVEHNLPAGSILVHCAAGISRSATLVCSYLMKKQRIGFKEAIALLRQARPSVLPNLGFERQLKKYELVTTAKASRSLLKEPLPDRPAASHHFPTLGVLAPAKTRLQGRSGGSASKQAGERATERDLQVLKVYNRTRFEKGRRFVISKKSASFNRHEGDGHFAANSTVESPCNHSPSTGHERRAPLPKPKSSMEELKEIYLAKRGGLERRVPTERNGTFYKASWQGRSPGDRL